MPIVSTPTDRLLLWKQAEQMILYPVGYNLHTTWADANLKSTEQQIHTLQAILPVGFCSESNLSSWSCILQTLDNTSPEQMLLWKQQSSWYLHNKLPDQLFSALKQPEQLILYYM